VAFIRVKNDKITLKKKLLKTDEVLKYWENKKDENSIMCKSRYCQNNTSLGGCIFKSDSKSDKRYIVPICSECSNKNEEFEVWENDLILINN
jgi:hypothetical protein